MNNPFASFVDWIKQENGFVIIVHVSPDGDTIGSGLALCCMLRYMGKRFDIVCEHDLPPVYSFLPLSNLIKKPELIENKYDNAIALDCAALDRMGSARDLFLGAVQNGNIDHHKSNSGFGKYVILDEKAAATGEILFKLYKEFGIIPAMGVQKDIATCLFTAISTDTGNFSYSNTTAQTFLISAELVNMGIGLADINRIVYRTVPIGKTRLKGYVLSNLRLYENGKIAAAIISQNNLKECGADVDDIEGMIDGVRDVDTVEIAIIIREKQNGAYKASLRSKRYADVSRIAEKFEGGGHVRAAGCDFDIRDGEEVLNMILNEAKLALNTKG